MSSKMASRRPLEHSFDFHWFLGFVPDRPGGRGRRRLPTLSASRRNHWFSRKPCWESSPSASCDNGPRKPQYRKLRFLWKYKLACIFCRPSAKRRGQHGSKRRWDRTRGRECGATDLKGYAPCRRPPPEFLEYFPDQKTVEQSNGRQ